MRRMMGGVALLSALALGACEAPPPPGPSVMAIPGQGKTWAEFQQDDAACQQFAAAQTGNTTPGTAASNSAVASAVAGTLLGAAAGAGIGAAAGNPGIGAAVGAGAGLLAGSAVGANASRAAGAATQQRYDMRYQQCMYGRGNQVPGIQAASAPPPARGPVVTPVYNQVAPPTNPNGTSTQGTTVTPVTPVTPVK